MGTISKSARETLRNMLYEGWHKLDWYSYGQKDDLINIASSYGFDDLVDEFQKTYSE
jgi:hypothetical protein